MSYSARSEQPGLTPLPLLQAHPAVLESAAVGSPDAKRGEIVKAFITLSDEAQAKYTTKEDLDKLSAEIIVRRGPAQSGSCRSDRLCCMSTDIL